MQRGRRQTFGNRRGGVSGGHRQRIATDGDFAKGAKGQQRGSRKDKALQFMQHCAAEQRFSAIATPAPVARAPPASRRSGAFAPATPPPVDMDRLKPRDVMSSALLDPPTCDCWTRPESAGPWIPANEWPGDFFDGIRGTAAMNGAKVSMCAKPQSAMGRDEHRIMHVSLNNGEICIDVPILETVGVTYYAVHWYCTTHRRFEREALFQQKPPSPIVWTSCAADE